MAENLEKIVFDTLQELGEETNNKALLNADKDTSIYGPGRNMDSLTLVRFISEVEEAVYDNMNVEVVIANEKAISMKHSPFRTVATFTDYLKQLIEDSQ
ncbi:MAG: hypothetical protein K9I68_12180 [Bacteroidales bacterium]|nr:hypothetical protein [Bacteroidales bacterium]MCF8339216.1 hypothetical protein [Bacteroidales bacterium]